MYSKENPLRIYLGDLTYDTVALSTEAFPLNIGYIASYCKKQFGDIVEITLFKYISDLENSILSRPPDILGLSNNAWNHRIGLEMFNIFKKQNENGLCIFGGPNFPLDFPSQKQFMDKNKEFDIYIPIEGEIGFSNIIEKIISENISENISSNLSKSTIDGCVIRDFDGKIKTSIPQIRTKTLDEIPSPYLNGMMDKFFDGKLSPMLQTNRGCPFLCTYCVDGNSSVSKVNNFSFERVKSELLYMAQHVPETTKSMFISDLNFGMIPRDLEICDYISELQTQYDFPKQIQATTGKNSKERIIQAIKRLNGALRLWMSVQSMDEQVLANIKRSNISLEHTMALAPVIKQSDLRTQSEVILGLPGESYETHIETIRKLIKAKMDNIVVYTCMMLDGAEMNTPQERKKWNFKTKFRILPRDFVKLKNGKKILEIEEVIVGSNTLSFDEYVKLRLISFAMYITNAGIVYDPILKFLRENNIDVFELFLYSNLNIKNSSKNVQNVFKLFEASTKNELWDSPEDIIAHYQNEKNYQKLLDGHDGLNVLLHYNAMMVGEFMNEWCDHILQTAKELLEKNNSLTPETLQKFESVSNFCRGLSFNPLGNNRLETNPEFSFHYDIEKWLKSTKDENLNLFRLEQPTKMIFRLNQQQYKFVQDKLNIFGTSSIGKSQTIKRTPIELLWRHGFVIET